jgi:hypothetical protein
MIGRKDKDFKWDKYNSDNLESNNNEEDNKKKNLQYT